MGFRKPVSVEFGKIMSRSHASAAMNGPSSKGLTKWVNKDISSAVSNNDWSELIAKAEASTRKFRNQFYR